jgi:hypothetical protein
MYRRFQSVNVKESYYLEYLYMGGMIILWRAVAAHERLSTDIISTVTNTKTEVLLPRQRYVPISVSTVTNPE